MRDWESIVLPLVALLAAFLLIGLALFLARKLTLLLEKHHKTNQDSSQLPLDDQPPSKDKM